MKTLKTLNVEIGQGQKDVSLFLLGVDEKYITQPPSMQSYPARFNPQVKPLWGTFLQSAEFKISTMSLPTSEEVWNYTIRAFIKLCKLNGVDAFGSQVDIVDNSILIGYLTMKRMVITRFFNSRKLLKLYRVKNIVRQYKVTHSSFSVVAECVLYHYGSRSDLEKYIGSRKVGFIRTTGPNRWHNVIDSNVRVVIETGDSEACLRYEIKALGSVYVPGSEVKPVTNQQLTNFIDQQIWGPVVRSHPFENISITRF
jgi:hypothetical protein